MRKRIAPDRPQLFMLLGRLDESQNVDVWFFISLSLQLRALEGKHLEEKLYYTLKYVALKRK